MHELTVDPTTQELSDLYEAFAERLQQIVRFSVRAPDAVIDDACQLAWGQLVGHCTRVRRETARAWLATTASREAVRLMRCAGCEVPLEELETPGQAAKVPRPDRLAELRARLDAIRSLPERQQRLVWLQGMGFTYAEMARFTGDTQRTVERQLLRAKRKLRA